MYNYQLDRAWVVDRVSCHVMSSPVHPCVTSRRNEGCWELSHHADKACTERGGGSAEGDLLHSIVMSTDNCVTVQIYKGRMGRVGETRAGVGEGSG